MPQQLWMCALHWDPKETQQLDWKEIRSGTADDAARKFALWIAQAHGQVTAHTLLDVYVVNGECYDAFEHDGKPIVAVRYDVHVLPPKGSRHAR